MVKSRRVIVIQTCHRNSSMMARRGVIGLLAGGVAALMSGCGFSGKPSYRVKVTVEVNTPQGVKTGSSVMEIYAQKNVALTSEEGSGFTSGIILR
jgi:hypothetical protein